MLDWIEQHDGLVQAAVGSVTALVWIIYLDVLVGGLRRQRRTEILINLGGKGGFGARALLSNLGFEPIYVLDVILTVWTDEEEVTSSVSDRTEVEDLGGHPALATLQGPLKSGEFVDLGSVEDLLGRAHRRSFKNLDISEVRRFEITVAALTAATNNIVAAKRSFRRKEGKGTALTAEMLYATQIRSYWGRKAIERQIQDLHGTRPRRE